MVWYNLTCGPTILQGYYYERENRKVKYSYEHGDRSLQHLKDMVSDTPDPEKSRIMSYLRTHCIAACPGIVKDEINPEKSIGSGNLYSDGKYYWNDAFFNYVDRYNIPVPAEFRDYIIQNHEQRAKRHILLRTVDCVKIHNNPCPGYHWMLTFFRGETVIDTIEGRNGEDPWRYKEFKSIIDFAERFIPKDLGSKYMGD